MENLQRVNEPTMQSSMNNGSGSSKLPWVVLAVIVLVLIVVAVLFRDKLLPNGGGEVVGADKASGYQAVFLTNGQVYFGKFTDTAAHYSTLRDIYYLQVTQPALQGSQDAPAQQQQPQLSLVKLGNELHGPVDEMKINRDQILFYEDIKEDGQVMQAIREYQANPPAENNTGAAPQQQQQQQAQPQTQQQTTPQTQTQNQNTQQQSGANQQQVQQQLNQ